MPTISEIQTCINNLTTASESAEFAILATEATRATSNNLSFSVATVADLPDLYTTNTNSGQIVFVVSLGIPVVSTRFYEWLGLDGRLIRKDGLSQQLWTWGLGPDGRLGAGTTLIRSSPGTTVGGGNTWCGISAGGRHTTALKPDGTLWTWGLNNFGQLGNLTTVNSDSPSTISGGITTWCRVHASYYHTAGVKTDGTLWTWGLNTCGRLGDGTVVNRSSPGQLAGGGWCQIGGIWTHSVAVKTDGTLWTWGLNSGGQLGNNSIINRSTPGQTIDLATTWCQANTGFYHTVAVKNDGTLWTWGCGASGYLGNNSVANRSSPVQTSIGGTTWCQSSAGSQTAAVKTDGTAWTWGSNSQGGLGTGAATTVSRSSPGITAGGGTTWCKLDTRSSWVGAAKTDGTLWTWGLNSSGQLGILSTANRSSPGTILGGGSTWCTVSTGHAHAAAISVC